MLDDEGQILVVEGDLGESSVVGGLVQILLQSSLDLRGKVLQAPPELAQLNKTPFDILGLVGPEELVKLGDGLGDVIERRMLEGWDFDVG